MRILILSYSYPPVANARAVRWSALAEEWARAGHEVTVLCSWVPGSARAERLNGVAVQRVGVRLAEHLRGRLAARRRSARGSLLDVLRSLAERAWRAIYWPDTSWVWLWPAYWRLRALLRDGRPHAVVSVSPTFSAVLLGMAALARSHPRPRWLIDLGDPFSWGEEGPPNNLRLYRRLNRTVERAAFRRADAVSVTTEETRAGYAAAFPESAAKIEVLPPLVALERGADAEPAGGPLSLVYLGTLYRTIRGPDFLLALLRRLLERPIGRRLELHLYGDVQDCRPEIERHADILGRALFVHGPVPRPHAIEAMRRARVLVNIGNRTSYQLPSKLVEYAALGKPILNIAHPVRDSSARFLASYPRHLDVLAAGPAPRDEQVARCERFLEDVAAERLAPVDPDWAAPYALGPIARRYLALLSE